MSKGLVLITGVNGYIAAVTAKVILDAGYSVRGTVRRLSSGKPVEDALKEYVSAGKFTIVEVPDITAEGAFDEAVKDVTAIAHLAAPVSFGFTDPEPVLHTAVNGTLSILNSSLKAGPQLKTFVYMSSIAAIRPAKNPPYTMTEEDWNEFSITETERLGKETPGPIIYSASKTAAEKAFWKFRDEKKPSYTMAAVNPVFVIGPPLVKPKTVAEIGETYLPVFKVFAGGDLTPANPLNNIDVRDVAKLTLYPIEHPAEANGQRFIAHSAESHPQAIADILRKAFPEAKGRIQEGNPGQGYREGYKNDPNGVMIDSEKGRKAIGGWTSFEKSVVDTAKALEHLI